MLNSNYPFNLLKSVKTRSFNQEILFKGFFIFPLSSFPVKQIIILFFNHLLPLILQIIIFYFRHLVLIVFLYGFKYLELNQNFLCFLFFQLFLPFQFFLFFQFYPIFPTFHIYPVFLIFLIFPIFPIFPTFPSH